MSSTWYDEMALAIRERDKCVAAIARWQEKLTEAETLMERLAQTTPAANGSALAAAPVADAGAGPLGVEIVSDPRATFQAPATQEA